MPLVQRAHGRHQANRFAAITSFPPRPFAQLSHRAKNLHQAFLSTLGFSASMSLRTDSGKW